MAPTLMSKLNTALLFLLLATAVAPTVSGQPRPTHRPTAIGRPRAGAAKALAAVATTTPRTVFDRPGVEHAQSGPVGAAAGCRPVAAGHPLQGPG